MHMLCIELGLQALTGAGLAPSTAKSKLRTKINAKQNQKAYFIAEQS
jgi:hypothetical protein